MNDDPKAFIRWGTRAFDGIEAKKRPPSQLAVIPAKAGIYNLCLCLWIPAFAGMTAQEFTLVHPHGSVVHRFRLPVGKLMYASVPFPRRA